MKKLLFTAISALAVAGVAQAAESTQFGVLRVPSSAKQTIVAVPWLASGTGNDSVKVADLVLTAGLTVGDELKYYDGSKYLCWRLIEDSQGKRWEASQNLNDNGTVIDNPTADAAVLDRGNAIILKRTGSLLSDGFCIMGKPASGSADISIGSGENVFSLIAPPSLSATDVNTGMNWTNIDIGDQLMIQQDGKQQWYVWKRTAKGADTFHWVNANTGVASGITIPVGEGIWFKSVGKSSNKKASLK